MPGFLSSVIWVCSSFTLGVILVNQVVGQFPVPN
jgi:hypothetical protein